MQPATELFVIMIFLFILGICILFASYMKDQLLVPIQGKLSSGGSGSTAVGWFVSLYDIFDQMFFFVAIGLGLVAVLMAYMTYGHPAFLFLSIVMFAIGLVLIPMFANIYKDISQQDKFQSYADDYPIMDWIFSYFPTFFWVFGFLIIIVLYAKMRGGGGV